MVEANDLVPIEEAARRLRVTRGTMWRRVKELKLPVYRTIVDRRKRLVSWSNLEKLNEPSLVVVATPSGSKEYALDEQDSAAFESAIGSGVRIIPGEAHFARYKLLAHRAIDTFTGGSYAVAMLLEASGPYATRDGGPFPIRDWYPEVLDMAASGFVVRKDGPIHSVWDIKKGATIADVSSDIPGLSACYDALLAWIGLNRSDGRLVRFRKLDDSLRAVAAGKVDVAYAVPTSQVVFELESGGGALRWLDLNPNASERDAAGAKRHREVAPFLSFVQNREGVSSALGAWGHSWTSNYFGRFVHADVTDDFAYNLAKWRSERDTRRGSYTPKGDSLEYVKAALPKVFIPLHDGAITYFKERGIWSAADDERQQRNLAALDSYVQAWKGAVRKARQADIAISSRNDDWLRLWEEAKQGLPRLTAVISEEASAFSS